MGMQSETRSCANCKGQFIIEPDDFGFYEKIGVPAPKLCPACRLQRRLVHRNERSYYRRTCDRCSKNIIATYPANSPFPVYCHHCWWSDDWSGHNYARDFDFTRPFFEQFKELYSVVPRIAMVNDDGVGSTNCEYTYDHFYSKNCYLSVCAWELENVAYSYMTGWVKDSIDGLYTYHSEMCCQGIRLEKCARCAYCRYSFSCTDCYLSHDLKGCSDCILCVGLRNKKYHIRNVGYSKEEYEQKKKEMMLNSRAAINGYHTELAEMIRVHPRPYANMIQCVNCTGDVLVNCKNAKETFFHRDFEDGKYLFMGDSGKNCYDASVTGRAELAYETATADESYGSMVVVFCLKGKNVHYSDYCHSGNELLGCIGLKKGEFSILNKRYSKEEYQTLYQKIKDHMLATGEWGEFFPMTLSPYAYNETMAADWIPLTKDAVLAGGLKWKEQEERAYSPDYKYEDIPDVITENDFLVGKVLECKNKGDATHGKCTTAFRLIEQELQLYSKLGIPLPDTCPNCRTYERLAVMKGFRLKDEQCHCKGVKDEAGVHANTGMHNHGTDACPNMFKTVYDSNDGVIYCDHCYQQELH